MEASFLREVTSLAAGAPLDHYFSNLHAVVAKFMEAPIFVAAVLERGSSDNFKIRYQRNLQNRDALPTVDERCVAAALGCGKAMNFGAPPQPGNRYLRSAENDHGSHVVAPLRVQQKTVGYIAVRHPMPDMFAEQHTALLAAAADVAALVASATRAEEQAQLRAREVHFMLETARALSTERDITRLLARFHGLVSGMMDAETFWVTLGSWQRAESNVVYCISRHKQETILRPIPLDGSLSGHVFREGAEVLIRSRQDWLPYLHCESDRTGIRSALAVPMRIGAHAIGAISVQSSRPDAYSERDRDLLAAIGEQAAIAIQNSEAIETAEARARELGLLSEVARSLTAQLSLPALCKTVCEHVRRAMDAPFVFVALEEPHNQSALIQYCMEDGVARQIDGPQPLQGTVAERVLEGGAPLVLRTLEEIEAHPRRLAHSRVGEPMQTVAIVPLRLHGAAIGIMSAQSRRPNAYAESDIRVLVAVADHLALALENAKLFNDARSRAERDPLTNLYHHRYLKTRLEQAVEDSRRTRNPFAVIMLDLDNFKLVNDTYGHPVGDEALRMATAVLLNACRANDVVGRYGGDEFMIVLPDTDRATAMSIADRIGQDLTGRHLSCADGRRIPIRASAGVAVFPNDGQSPADVVAAADAALYQSKRHGRPIGRLQNIGSATMRLIGDFGPVSELLGALISRDPSTREHLEHVNRVAWSFAQELQLDDSDRKALLLGSVLHDVGKIAIPDRVLRKPGKLTESEYDLVRRHPEIGASLIEHLPGFERAAEAVRHHHEAYDGKGYPDGLAADSIPLIARIVTLIDVYSALILDRPYHKGMSTSEAVAELRRCAGKQFDPVLVERFATMIQSTADSH